MNPELRRPVLILGAGINGAAVARELLLNNVPVIVVDTADIACGATSRSSRLIHGGLRYLEHGDFDLVQESLAERSRLRKLAPQFVEPLRLFIPVSRRVAGLMGAAFRFFGSSRFAPFRWMAQRFASQSERGLWLVRGGLWLYDVLAKEPDFPKHSVVSATDPKAPHVDAAQYRWLCAYTDAQMRYPERFVVSLLADARQLAQENETDFHVFTYHRARLEGTRAEIVSIDDERQVVQTLHPALVINATGAWGDITLDELNVPSQRLFGGTKGSHFVSHQPQFRKALGGNGIYVEADDGRLVFLLPFGQGVLVGTTDERFDGRPENAIATPSEIDYLLQMVNEIFPRLNLTIDDVDVHYSGVRPLPYIADGKTASIPRGHWIVHHDEAEIPMLTLVGGKITTARMLAEEVVAKIGDMLNFPCEENSRDRSLPGGKNYPPTQNALKQEWNRLAETFNLSLDQIKTLWSLCGNEVEAILYDTESLTTENLADTDIPLDYVRWVIRHEWVLALDDLVERRLMLIYQPNLSDSCLHHLAQCLVDENRLDPSQLDTTVQATIDHLQTVYGKKVVSNADCGIRIAE